MENKEKDYEKILEATRSFIASKYFYYKQKHGGFNATTKELSMILDKIEQLKNG